MPVVETALKSVESEEIVADPDQAAFRVKLRFLGGCDVAGPGGPLRLESAKTTALLVFLAIQGTPQTRQKLMGLLWGTFPKNSAPVSAMPCGILKKSLALSGTTCYIRPIKPLFSSALPAFGWMRPSSAKLARLGEP